MGVYEDIRNGKYKKASGVYAKIHANDNKEPVRESIPQTTSNTSTSMLNRTDTKISPYVQKAVTVKPASEKDIAEIKQNSIILNPEKKETNGFLKALGTAALVPAYLSKGVLQGSEMLVDEVVSNVAKINDRSWNNEKTQADKVIDEAIQKYIKQNNIQGEELNKVLEQGAIAKNKELAKMEQQQNYDKAFAEEFIKEQLIEDTFGKPVEEFRNQHTYLPQKAGQIVEGAGSMIPSLYLGAKATGGMNPTTKAGQFAQKTAGMLPFMAQASGGSMEQALNEGASFEDAYVYSKISGLTEGIIESISGGIGGTVGNKLLAGKLGKEAVERISKNIAGKYALKLADAGIDIVGEGLEEVLAAEIDPYLKRMTYDEQAELATNEERLQTFIDGMLTSILLKGGQAGGNYIANKAANTLNNTDDSVKNLPKMDSQTSKLLRSIDEHVAKGESVNLSNTPSNELNINAIKNAKVGKNVAPESPTNALQGVSKQTILPTQKIQETVNSAKIAGMSDFDVKKATDLHKMLQSGANLKFYDSKNVPAGVDARAVGANGFYLDGTLWINKDSKRQVEKILGHELTHHLENTEMYNDFANSILDSNLFYDYITSQGYDNVAQFKENLRQRGYNEQEMDSEMVSMFVEDNLFDSQEKIDRLARENRTLAQKILNWLSDMKTRLVGTSQEKELLRIENMYRKALEQSRNVDKTSTDAQYSVGGPIGARNIQNNPKYANIMEDYKKANSMLNEGAKNSETIIETGWYKDTDGNVKYEFTDEDMALKNSYKFDDNKIYPLDRILKHDILFEAYPQLRDYTVISMDIGKEHKAAIFSPLKVILLNNQKLKTREQVEYSLIHEIQHAIQNIEGFPGSRTNINGKYAYYTSLGEIESKDTSNRLRMLAEERKINIPETAKENPTHPGLENYLQKRTQKDIEKDNKYLAKKEKTDALKESVKKFMEGRIGFDDFEEDNISNISKTTSEDDKLSSRTDGRGRLAGKGPAFSLPENIQEAVFDEEFYDQYKYEDRSKIKESLGELEKLKSTFDDNTDFDIAFNTQAKIKALKNGNDNLYDYYIDSAKQRIEEDYKYNPKKYEEKAKQKEQKLKQQQKLEEEIKNATPHKREQYNIIQETNPAPDEYHTWIRSPKDIKTFEEVIAEEEGFGWGDFDIDDAKEALRKGTIRVYSSYPIKNGTFVSTSYQQALDYAGGEASGVHSRVVALDSVAWINGDEGQYAKVYKKPSKVSFSLPETDVKNYLEENSMELRTNGSLVANNLTDKQIKDLVKIYKANGYEDVSTEYLEGALKRGSAFIPREVADVFIEKQLGYKPQYDTTKIYEDAEGNKLTKEQVEFYKDSAVRDIRGRLIPVYHRTDSEFYTFDKNASARHGKKYGQGFYFSITPENYGNREMKVYLNAKEGEFKYVPKQGYYIVQEPNQIKNVDNTNPTENADIRYSVNPIEIAKRPPNPQSGLDALKRAGKEKTGNTESSFARNIYNQNIFDDKFKDIALDDKNVTTYERISNKETLQEANDAINEQGQKWVDRFLDKSDSEMKAKDIAGGFILMNRYQQAGDYESMLRVAEKLRKAGTKQGQTIQLFSVLGRMTPEGMTYYAQKELSKAYDEILKNKTQKWADEHKDEFKLTDRDIDFIQRRVNQAAKLPEGRDKYVLLAEIAERIQNKIPPQPGQALKALARNSMLLNPKTMVRNVLGNVIIAPAHVVSDFVGAGIDKAISNKTGVRTTGTFKTSSLEGAKKGFYESFDDFRRHISTREMSGDRFELGKGGKSFNENHTGRLATPRNALSKALNGLDRVTGFLLESGDRPFYETWFINSLNNQMKLNNVAEPTAEMIEIATDEALQRTWQDNNAYTKTVTSVRNGLNKINIKGYGLGDMVMPFVKTPANLTKAVVDFSPLGAINAAIKTSEFNNAIGRGEATPKQQRAVVKAWSQVITGSLGMAIATALANAGILAGGGDEDKDVRNFEQNVLGIKPYSIKIGDKTYTYDWAQPLGTSAAMVADTVKSLKNAKDTESKVSAILNGLESGASVLLDQSFVSGIRNLFEEDNLINALIETGLNEPAKFTPQILSQIAQIQDDTARTSYVYNNPLETAKNKIKAKIPGQRQTLEPSVDVLGREVKTDNSVANVMFNPSNTAFARTTKGAEEMYRVYQATGDKATIAQVAPYYFNVGTDKIVLTPKQRTQYQKTTGKIASDGVENLLKSNAYEYLEDVDKAEILKDLYSYGNAIAKEEVSTKYLLPKEYQKIKDSGMKPEEYILMKYIANSGGTKKEELYNALVNGGYTKKQAENFLEDYKGYKFEATNTLPTLAIQRSKLPTLKK